MQWESNFRDSACVRVKPMIDLCLRLESRSVFVGQEVWSRPQRKRHLFSRPGVRRKDSGWPANVAEGGVPARARRVAGVPFFFFLSEVETRGIGIGWNGEPAGLLARRTGIASALIAGRGV